MVTFFKRKPKNQNKNKTFRLMCTNLSVLCNVCQTRGNHIICVTGVFDHYWDFSVELMDQIDDNNAHFSICEVMHESKHKNTMFSKCISFHTKHSQQKKKVKPIFDHPLLLILFGSYSVARSLMSSAAASAQFKEG